MRRSAPAREAEAGAVAGDEFVGAFGKFGKDRMRFVIAQRPLAVWVFCESAEYSFRAGMNHAVGFNELEGSVELFAGNFGKSGGNLRVLGGQIIHRVTGHPPPAANPKGTEIAIAIENLRQGFTVFLLPAPIKNACALPMRWNASTWNSNAASASPGVFPNESSLLRLITALLSETSDDWETGKIYLNMENQNPPSA